MTDTPQTLSQVRTAIDAIDGELIHLLARRQYFVEQAGRLKPKNNAQAVADPERVAQVIADRRQWALAVGLSPEVAEAVWQSMIAAFIELELKVNKTEQSD